MIGFRPPTALLAPVERIGTETVWAGLGTTTWNGFAPSLSSASSARCTLTGRDCVSEKIATGSPAFTSHWLKTRANASIHLPSMRSCSMGSLPSTGRFLARLDLHEKSYYDFSYIEREADGQPRPPARRRDGARFRRGLSPLSARARQHRGERAIPHDREGEGPLGPRMAGARPALERPCHGQHARRTRTLATADADQGARPHGRRRARRPPRR